MPKAATPADIESIAEEALIENKRLRSQLANIQAEAARVVGDIEIAAKGCRVGLEIKTIVAIGLSARDFLASLPTPAVVAVPIEPGEGDVETMARAAYERRHRGLKNCWSWDSDGLDREHPGQRALCLEQARAAYRALVKRHGG